MRQLTQLFLLIEEKHPMLLPTARWLLISSQLAAAAIHHTTPKEKAVETLVEFTASESPELARFLGELVQITRDPARRVLAEVLLEELLLNEHWNHPAEIFFSPPIESLLLACHERIKSPPRDLRMRRRLDDVRAKLERAHALSEKARQRRQTQNFPQLSTPPIDG